MSHKMKKLDFASLLMILATAVSFFVVTESFARGGMRLYSVGNSGVWSASSSWSMTSNGKSSVYIPQSDDTLIIDRTIIQNMNVSFSGNGSLQILNNGLLRGDNMNLAFTGSSQLKCDGEIRINNLTISENASLSVGVPGLVTVKNTCLNNSSALQAVAGKLSVTGTLKIDGPAQISGNGTVESAHFDGNGSLLGVSPVASVADGSTLSAFNWKGNVSSNWNEPLNWTGGVVPSDLSNVSILASIYNPEILQNAISGNLVINSGAVLTVNPNAVLNINGNLLVKGSGQFLLKNTIAKKSSLLLNGDATGSIQSEYQVLKEQKNLVSSPVDMAYSSTFVNMFLRTYDESAGQWGGYIVPTDNVLQVMQGYELYSLYSETRTFEGTPDQEPKSYAISNSGNGLNLTGNPFPCYIDWENNDNNAWQRNDIASAIYYPDPSGSGNFSVYLPGGNDAVSLNNGSRYIAPMQGFFVKAENQGALVVNKNSRVSSFTESKYTVKNNAIKFRLNDASGLSDEAMFRVLDNATYGFDNNLDAVKIKNDSDAPMLSVESDDNVEYAVNTVPSINSSMNVSLKISCTKAGQYQLSAMGSAAFEYRYPVILEDKELGKFIDLRADSVYSFYHTPDMNANRFELHFYSPTGIEQTAVTTQISDPISSINVQTGGVTVNGSDNTIYNAALYTVDGKLISYSKGSLSAGINLATGNYAAGVCILKLVNGMHTITKKVITR